ncbi:MAG: hypothetical protein V4620_02465 [Bacteroidota bacterium]
MKSSLIYLLIVVILFSSCGSSTIVLSDNSRPYAIYVDKQFKGNKSVKIRRSGLPQKKLIEVKDASGNVVGHEKISRDFSIGKFLVSFLYLYPLIFFSWEYDKKIEIYIDKAKQNSRNPWDMDSTSKSAWD